MVCNGTANQITAFALVTSRILLKLDRNTVRVFYFLYLLHKESTILWWRPEQNFKAWSWIRHACVASNSYMDHKQNSHYSRYNRYRQEKKDNWNFATELNQIRKTAVEFNHVSFANYLLSRQQRDLLVHTSDFFSYTLVV